MRWVDFPVQFESEMIRRLEQVITTLLYGSWILIWHISHAWPLVCCIFSLIPISTIFSFFRRILLKKTKLQTTIILFLQLSPHHQRMMMMKHKLTVHLKMEHQVTTLPCQSFPIKAEGYSVISSIWGGVSLTSVFWNGYSSGAVKKKKKKNKSKWVLLLSSAVELDQTFFCFVLSVSIHEDVPCLL